MSLPPVQGHLRLFQEFSISNSLASSVSGVRPLSLPENFRQSPFLKQKSERTSFPWYMGYGNLAQEHYAEGRRMSEMMLLEEDLWKEEDRKAKEEKSLEEKRAKRLKSRGASRWELGGMEEKKAKVQAAVDEPPPKKSMWSCFQPSLPPKAPPSEDPILVQKRIENEKKLQNIQEQSGIYREKILEKMLEEDDQNFSLEGLAEVGLRTAQVTETAAGAIKKMAK